MTESIANERKVFSSIEELIESKTKAQFISEEEFKKILDYDQEALVNWANRISNHYWGYDIVCNLTTMLYEELDPTARVYGFFRRFHDRPNMEIAISRRLVKHNHYRSYIVEQILKHELCHSHIFKTLGEKACQDFATPFENEIQRIGAVSQMDILTGNFVAIKYKRKDK